MPTPVIENVARVEVRGTLFGQLIENVWYCQTSAAPDIAELTGIAGVFQLNYGGIAGSLSQDISFREVFVKYIGAAQSPEFTLVISPPQAGGVVEDSMPSNVALCISLRSALAGRRFRGRKYFSGIPLSKVVADVVDSTFANTLVTNCNDIIGDLVTLGNPLQIASFVGLTSVPVQTAVVTDLNSDSQRRRLIGRGR